MTSDARLLSNRAVFAYFFVHLKSKKAFLKKKKKKTLSTRATYTMFSYFILYVTVE